MKIDTKKRIVEYINTIKGYEGYVQFSHRPIDKERDVFIGKEPSVVDEDGFIFEAHFSNEKESIAIRQLNGVWFVSTTSLNGAELQEYISEIQGTQNIKMAQIWEAEADPLCEGMQVKKLKRVVFAGFSKGEER